MAQRSDLQALLESLLGSESVYFQPPPTVQMEYPSIVYRLNNIDITHANNKPYEHKKRYQVTVVDRDPDSDIHEKVGNLSTASYDRFYTADGLNHHVYNLYW